MPRCAVAAFAALVILSGVWGARRATADEFNPDYAALRKAVLDGKDIRMVVDLSACQVHGTDKPGPQIKGSMRFDGYMVLPDGTIAFATTHFTVRPDKSPVREFLSYRVHANGKVDTRTAFLDAATFAVLQESALDCDIGKSAVFHW